MTDARTETPAEGNRPWWAFGCSPHLTPTDRRNSRRLNLATLGWMAVFIGSLYILNRSEGAMGPWQYPLAALPSLLLLVLMTLFVKFVREADELTRKIQLESLAIGFGAGLWFMFTWALLEQTGVPELDVSDGVIAMAAAYALNVARLHRKYS